VHPLVGLDRAAFKAAHGDAPLIVLDIPLLFETGGDAACDATLVVTTDPDEQRRRVLARGTSAETFEDLLSRQMPDAEKRARASHVIRTDTLDGTRKAVADLVSKLTEGTE
jgi:dephospho-CoA kinase